MLLRPADMAQGQRGLPTRACSLSLSLVWARTGAFQPLPRSCCVSMTATCINARCDSTRHDNSHVYPRPLLRPSSLFEIQGEAWFRVWSNPGRMQDALCGLISSRNSMSNPNNFVFLSTTE